MYRKKLLEIATSQIKNVFTITSSSRKPFIQLQILTICSFVCGGLWRWPGLEVNKKLLSKKEILLHMFLFFQAEEKD